MSNKTQHTRKRFVGSNHFPKDDVRNYQEMVKQFGAENVIFSRQQAETLLYYGFINKQIIAKISRTENPKVEAFYGYKNWNDKHYKMYVKFKHSKQYLKFDGTSKAIFVYNLIESVDGLTDLCKNPFKEIVPSLENCVLDRYNDALRVLNACGASHV